jgi:hypothetical protein
MSDSETQHSSTSPAATKSENLTHTIEDHGLLLHENELPGLNEYIETVDGRSPCGVSIS